MSYWKYKVYIKIYKNSTRNMNTSKFRKQMNMTSLKYLKKYI